MWVENTALKFYFALMAQLSQHNTFSEDGTYMYVSTLLIIIPW